MATVQGMLTLDQLIEQVKSGAIDTVLVQFTDHYGRFMGKRVDADYFLLDSEFGHSASGLDAHKWAPRLKEFMDSL